MTRHPEGNVFYRNLAHDYPVIERGEGVYLVDTAGKRYLDASGGPLVANIGHGVGSVADAMAEQAGRVGYVHGERFTTAALERYSQRLAARVPMDDPRFYFLCSGSEATEAAVKFARQVQLARGEAGRDLIISRWGSYHGATLGCLALSGKPSMRTPYASMFRDMPHIEPPYCYRCPFRSSYPACDLACARQLETAILHYGPGRVAAFIAEPVGGATLGGIVPPEGYWQLVREICDRYGVLLIADEVLTGFGRTGLWFALQHWGVRPDVMTMAKGMAGGYMPLAAMAARGSDVETVRRIHGNFNHGGTFSHHAVGAAAANAVLDYLEARDLVGRAAELGARLGGLLRNALADIPTVGDVRGVGMMWGVEFVADRETRAPFPADLRFSDRVCQRCMELGVLFYPGRGSADGVRGDHLMIAPPYVITEEEMGQAVNALSQAVRQIAAAG